MTIDQLKLLDIRKKNILVIVAFSISILAALLFTVVQGDYNKSIFYGAELITVFASFVLMKFAFKKENLFMYVMIVIRSEEHTSELQSRGHLVCRLLLEKKKKSIK